MSLVGLFMSLGRFIMSLEHPMSLRCLIMSPGGLFKSLGCLLKSLGHLFMAHGCLFMSHGCLFMSQQCPSMSQDVFRCHSKWLHIKKEYIIVDTLQSEY